MDEDTTDARTPEEKRAAHAGQHPDLRERLSTPASRSPPLIVLPCFAMVCSVFSGPSWSWSSDFVSVGVVGGDLR